MESEKYPNDRRMRRSMNKCDTREKKALRAGGRRTKIGRTWSPLGPDAPRWESLFCIRSIPLLLFYKKSVVKRANLGEVMFSGPVWTRICMLWRLARNGPTTLTIVTVIKVGNVSPAGHARALRSDTLARFTISNQHDSHLPPFSCPPLPPPPPRRQWYNNSCTNNPTYTPPATPMWLMRYRIYSVAGLSRLRDWRFACISI